MRFNQRTFYYRSDCEYIAPSQRTVNVCNPSHRHETEQEARECVLSPGDSRDLPFVIGLEGPDVQPPKTLDANWLYHALRALMAEYFQQPGIAISTNERPPFVAFGHNDRFIRIQQGCDGFDLRVLRGPRVDALEPWMNRMADDLPALATEIRAYLFGQGEE